MTRRRCLRLSKDCQPLQTLRKRKTANKPSATKTERLEEKLDGLYKLLQSSAPSTFIAGQNAPLPAPPTPTPQTPESLQSHVASAEDGGDFGPCPSLRLHSPTTGPDSSYVTSGTRSTTYHCPESFLISGSEPSSDEAEECLNIFRSQMIPCFPFIVVQRSTTAHELRRDRPFLWLCIMSIASKSSAQQMALRKEIKITMGREILVEGRTNIDLLLGLLVFVAWYVDCVS